MVHHVNTTDMEDSNGCDTLWLGKLTSDMSAVIYEYNSPTLKPAKKYKLNLGKAGYWVHGAIWHNVEHRTEHDIPASRRNTSQNDFRVTNPVVVVLCWCH